MAAFIGAMFTTPIAALCTLVQGASCAISTVNLASCLCHSALGRKTGISPTAAKLFYTLLLGLASFVAMILRYHSEKFNFGAFGDLNCAQDGSFCKGDQAVFRISFILVLFFTLMMLLSFGDESFHRGYWGIKVLAVIVGVIGSFFIPPEAFNMHAYAWFSRLGSLIFLVLQILILIDFAYQVNDSWVAKAYGNNGEATDLFGEATNRNWLYAILVSAAALCIASIVGVVLMYVFYASCGVGIAFTTMSMLSVILMTVLSVFRDKIVKRDMEGAILPTALVSVYVVFLCWSALESNPDENCRPSSRHTGLDFVFGAIFASITLMWSTFSVTSNAGHLVKGESLVKAGNDQDSGEVELGGPVVRDDLEQPILDDNDDADDTPVYSSEQPWSFHLIMIAASMYLAMLLTDWGSSKGPANSGEASMWMKIIAQWLTTLLFSWTLIAPAILKDRVFD